MDKVVDCHVEPAFLCCKSKKGLDFKFQILTLAKAPRFSRAALVSSIAREKNFACPCFH